MSNPMQKKFNINAIKKSIQQRANIALENRVNSFEELLKQNVQSLIYDNRDPVSYGRTNDFINSITTEKHTSMRGYDTYKIFFDTGRITSRTTFDIRGSSSGFGEHASWVGCNGFLDAKTVAMRLPEWLEEGTDKYDGAHYFAITKEEFKR